MSMLKENLLLIYKRLKYYKIFKEMKSIKILNDKKTVDLIINTKKSVARFGDGELGFVFCDDYKIGFQNSSKELSRRLREILSYNSKNVLIGLPNKLINLKNNTYDSKLFWMNYIIMNYEKLLPILDKNKTYINTNFTRFYMDYKIKSNMKEKIKDLKKIWNNREVVIIEGEKTKLGVGNDLFKNTLSIKRIVCPSTNAFNYYEEILKEAKRVEKTKLILVALGPTATVLAYDLGMMGYQAIDVGHIDIEYEWYLKNTKTKILIDGKYVNEVKGETTNKELISDDYKNSIIKRII